MGAALPPVVVSMCYISHFLAIQIGSGSVFSAPYCCKAAPGSYPGREPHGGLPRLSFGNVESISLQQTARNAEY